MELWKNHWHCILPAVGILIALFVMHRTDKKYENQKSSKKEIKRSEGEHDGKE